jgi:ribosome maturation factor RimP
MIEKEKIHKLINDFIERNGIFIVSLNVNPANKITLLVDSMNGIRIDDCVQLSRVIESGLERDETNFELEVSSPGLDAPLKVEQQYLKNLGKEIEVFLQDGSKLIGKLLKADHEGFTIEEKKMVKIEGKKQVLLENKSYLFNNISKVKIVVKV